MKYCKECVLPDTRPGLIIENDGICNACKSNKQKEETIDWQKRERAFGEVVDNAKKNNSGYDCVIPVSGGKDSHWQVINCLEAGLTPLAVTWKTPARTRIGYKNLQNLVSLGVDHIDYQVNPEVEKKFMYKALVKYGSTALPMHMALFNIPLKIAFKFDIPLVIWGENSAFEYGTDDEELKGIILDSKWLEKFGLTYGTTADDWIDQDLTKKELTPYFGPTDQELEDKGIRAIFMGYYFKWDPENTLNIASKKGFQPDSKGPRTGLYNYADIDDEFISIHHYIKWYKFGFTRLFDNLSLEIRNSRISREKAIQIIRERSDETPHEDIENFCKFVKIPKNHFFEIIDKFRNKEIWSKENGVWKINDFIISNYNWK